VAGRTFTPEVAYSRSLTDRYEANLSSNAFGLLQIERVETLGKPRLNSFFA
jgi:hypothetical protein